MCLFLSFAYACYLLWVIFTVPYIGLFVTASGHSVVVDDIGRYSWADTKPINEGDQLLLVDGKPAIENTSLRRTGYVKSAGTITILRGQHVITYRVNDYLTFSNALFSFIVPFLFAIVCLIMGVFLIRLSTHDESLTVLILFLATIGPVFLTISAHQRLYDYWSRIGITLTMCFSLVFLIHFLYVFFKDALDCMRFKFLLMALYIGAGIAVALRIFHIHYPVELVFTLLAFSVLLYLLIEIYRKTHATTKSRIVQILFSGLFLALFPFVAFYTLPALIDFQPIMNWEWTTPFFLLLPITLFYLVVTTSLIDVSFIFGRLSYYSVISLVLTTISLLGYFIMNRDDGSILAYFRLGLIIFALTLIILYVKEYVDFRLRGWLFPKRKDYQMSLNHFLRRMKPGYKLSDLAFIMKREVERVLPVEKADLVQIESDQNKTIRIDNSDTDMTEYSELPSFTLQGKIQDNSFGFTFVLANNHKECIALVGKWKKPRRQLNIDEKVWLETFLNYAQISIENLYKADELVGLISGSEKEQDGLPQTVKKALIKVSERERAQLAQDLHDTIVQDQLALARDIDAGQVHWSDSEFAAILGRIRGRILDNVDTLRHVIRDLHPRFIHLMPLTDVLNQLFQRIRQRAYFSLHVSMDEHLDLFNPDLQTNMYRVIQELLNNAIKHAEAKNVTVTLLREDDYILLLYDDDGVGMDTQQIGSSFSTMGLSGVIGRVKSVGGKLIIDSLKDDAEKKGLHIEIKWPTD
jgi:two-component system sensor histidine kinase ComP